MNEKAKVDASSSALPTSVADDLEAYGVSHNVRAVIEAASTQLSITSHHVPHTYVSILPGSGGFIACHVHHERLTVPMPPAKAETVAQQYGWKVDRPNGSTSFVKIPATSLTTVEQRSVASDLLMEAIKWREHGPQPFSQRPGANAIGVPLAATCPIHFTELLGGRCDLCPT